MRSLRNFLAISLALGCFVSPLLAQDAAEQAPEATDEEGVYIETVDVNVVNVDVWVTDKKGNPINGLTRDDFEILEDRRPIAITNFFAVEDGRATQGEWETQAVPGAPTVPGVEAAEVQVPEDQRLYLVVYIDNFNIRPFNRNRVFRRLREFLNDDLTREDRVMLVSYDRSLHVRHQFTSDPGLIATATFELEKMTGYSVHRDSERRDLMRDIEEAENESEVLWRIKQYAEGYANDLAFSIDAMKEIVDSMAGLPGRKALLYVSDGLPMTPGEDLYYAVTQKFHQNRAVTEAREFDANRQFRELTNHANTGRVTFYTIDAAGLRAPGAGDVQYETANVPGMGSFVESVYVSNMQSPMIFMAEQTGGRAIFNTNDVGPRLTEMASDFRTYYSLGYSPVHSGSGRYYKIEVKVKNRKGLKVRHRAGYRDLSRHDRMADSARATLMYGFESNPLEAVLRLGAPEQSDKGLFDVPILVGIPISKIVMVPQTGAHEARVRLYFSAMDEDGDMSDVQEVELPIHIPNDQMEVAMNGHYPFQSALKMRSGTHRVTVGVWDELGAISSFVSRSVRVGDE